MGNAQRTRKNHWLTALETKGRMSAVERLAASKPKYVKSQQVVNSTQEPVISLGSGVTRHRLHVVHKPAHQGRYGDPALKNDQTLSLLYRQKCELLRGAANDRKHHITRKLLLNSVNKNVPLLEAVTAGLLAVPQCEKLKRSGKGVSRSHSDISSRYSKNFADFEAFFKYCGLDGEVIESLGKENFSARSDEIAINIRSISVSTSDDGFSRSSGGSDGLLEDELQKKMRQGTSVIERNARIIKWLYSCKNATETGKKLRDLN
uniref:Family with sequence similarity 110 member C n=1 Tax=Lates calcarifer TaxID=8187 RepID=A0A4W6DAL9_LATCA